jgi:membrane-bound lytic murein transglycosylase D
VRRFGIKAAIVASGVAVAAGTLHKTTYVSRTPLAQRIVASAPVNVKTPWGTSRSADSSIAPGGLDAGVDHARIAYWVKRLSTTLGGDFSRQLEKKAKYSDMIEAKLEAKQMPKDLVYLAMIESEFNPNAKSPVKALGLWQFMSGTARQFGLIVRGRVDERRDPERATDAAVAYLAALHDRLGSWYLAAAAYNSGEGAVVKALRTVTGKSVGTDDDFFRILPLLPRETQDYVPKLIAAARVGNAPARYGLTVHEASADGDVVPPTTAVAAASVDTSAKAKPAAKGKKATKRARTKARTAANTKTTAKTKAVHHAPKQ